MKKSDEITVKKLKKLLENENPVHFSFKKKDGTDREVYATRNFTNIPEENHPIDASTNKSENLKFFDMDKKEWRSLSMDTKKVTLIG